MPEKEWLLLLYQEQNAKYATVLMVPRFSINLFIHPASQRGRALSLGTWAVSNVSLV